MADANINIGVNVQSKSLAQLETQLASLNSQLKQVPVNSAKFKQLTAEFQSVSKSIEGANAKLKGFNPEETFGKLAKVAGGVGAAFAAANLFIGDNEEATKANAEAQKALVAVLGLSQVAEAALSAYQLIRTNALIKTNEQLVVNTALTEQQLIVIEANAASERRLGQALDSKTKAQIRADIFTKNSGKTAKEYGDLIREGYKNAAIEAQSSSKAVEGFGTKIANSFKGAAKAVSGFVTSTGGAITIIVGLLLYINKLNTDTNKAAIQVAQYGVELDNLGDTLKKVGDGAEDTFKALINYNALLDAGALSAQERTKYEEGLRKKLKEQGVTQEEINKILRDGKADIDAYIDSLERQAKAIAIFDKLVEKYKELFELQADQSKSAPSFLQTLGNTYKSLGDIGSFAVSQVITQQENLNESTKEVNAEITKLKGLIEAPIKAGDKNAIGGAKAQLDGFIGAGKTAATDITSFLRSTRDEIVKAEKEGYEEQKQLLLNAQADRLEDLKKENKKIQDDENATDADKLKARNNFNKLVKLQTKINNQELEDLQKEHKLKLLAIDKDTENTREAVEAQAYETRLQTLKNSNSALTDTEEAKLKQDAKILEGTIQIELEKLDLLESSYQKQKALAEAELKLAKPEDRKPIENRIAEADAVYKNATVKANGDIIQLNNQLQDLLTGIIVAGIKKRASAEQAGVTSKIVNDKQRATKEKQDRVAAIDEEIKLYAKGTDKFVELTTERNNLIRDLDKEALKDQLDLIQKFVDAVFQAGQAIASLLQGQQQLISAQFDLEAAIVEAGYKDRFALIDEETAKLDAQAEKKVKYATKEEKQRAVLAKQRSVLEKQQAEELEAIRQNQVRSNAEAAIAQAELNFALVSGQAVANAALAIVRQFADYPLPVAIPASALIAVATGIQIAQANQAKNLAITQAQTQLASLGGGGGSKGGRVSKAEGGLITGAGNGVSDSVPANLSNGEFVVNANATQKFLPLLSALNSSGLQGGNPVNPTGGNNDMVELLQRIDDKLSQPNRAYVVATDIQDIQNKQNYINRRSNVL
jgi:hypothetical protein